MPLLDRMAHFWRPRAERSTLVINCDPDPRGTSFSARLCNAYLAGARSAARPVQYFSAGEADRAGESISGIRKTDSQKGREITNMLLICPIYSDAVPLALGGFFSGAWMRAMASSLRPRTIRIVFTTEIPAFLQRAAVQRCAEMQKFYSHFPASRIRQDFIGSADTMKSDQYLWWIAMIRDYGSKGI